MLSGRRKIEVLVALTKQKIKILGNFCVTEFFFFMYELKKKIPSLTEHRVRRVAWNQCTSRNGTSYLCTPVKCLKRRRICALCFHTVPAEVYLLSLASRYNTVFLIISHDYAPSVTLLEEQEKSVKTAILVFRPTVTVGFDGLKSPK